MRCALLLLLAAGCAGRAADVVLYCAVDREHAAPVVRAFEEASGLSVEVSYDVEASKSVGLRRRLEEEAARPRCDVFWNNEVVQTVLLARAGLLDAYVSPEATDIPALHRDPTGLWAGFAARARVLIVNTELRPTPADWPEGTANFLDASSAGRCGMARPLTGTTAAQAGAWLSLWGRDETFDLFERMRANDVRFGPGNAHVMRLVREGELEFGFTDTDDVKAAVDAGFPVSTVVPDQGQGDLGVVIIPNTVSLVSGAPHAEAARRLIDFLLSKRVEEMLATGPSAQIPLRPDVPHPPHVLDLSKYRIAPVDWAAAAAAWDEQADALEAFFND